MKSLIKLSYLSLLKMFPIISSIILTIQYTGRLFLCLFFPHWLIEILKNALVLLFHYSPTVILNAKLGLCWWEKTEPRPRPHVWFTATPLVLRSFNCLLWCNFFLNYRLSGNSLKILHLICKTTHLLFDGYFYLFHYCIDPLSVCVSAFWSWSQLPSLYNAS